MEQLLQLLEPWMIPIVVMVCVTIIVTVSVVGGIIKAALKRKEPKSLSDNKEFLNALRDFKENIDRRVANLEEIASAENPEPASMKSGGEKRIKKTQSAIELELDNEPTQKEKNSESAKLRNMLNQ